VKQELGTLQLDNDHAKRIMEELRLMAAAGSVFGVTVIGPYVTLRFGKGHRLVQVSMMVTSITDSTVLEPIDDEDK
jgi:hypothetical protein